MLCPRPWEMPCPDSSSKERAGHRQPGWWEQPEAAFAAPAQFVLPGGAVSVSGTGAGSPGQVPAGHVSLTSCLGFVQGFEPLAFLIICFPLSCISGPSLELAAGMSPACLGEHVSQLRGAPEEGGGLMGLPPLPHLHTGGVSRGPCPSFACGYYCYGAVPASILSQPAVTRQKKDLRVVLGSAPQDPPARVRMS